MDRNSFYDNLKSYESLHTINTKKEPSNRFEFYDALNGRSSLKHSQNPMYGQQYDQVKYYRREGEPGKYRYYWTKEEWDAHIAEEQAKAQQLQQPKFNSREQVERQAINKNVNSQINEKRLNGREQAERQAINKNVNSQNRQQEYNKQSQSLSPDAQRYQKQNQTQQPQRPKFNSREQAERQAINKNVNSQINEKRLNERDAKKEANTDWDAKIKEENEKAAKEIANHNEKSRIQNEGNKQYIDYMKNNSLNNKKSYGNNFDQDFQTALKEMGIKDLYYRDGEIFYNDSNSDNKIKQAESKLKTYEAQYKEAEQKIASAKTSKEKYEAEKYANEIAAQCRQAGDEITQAYHEKQKAAYTKFDEVTKYMEENIKNKKNEDKNLIEEGIDWIKKKFR